LSLDSKRKHLKNVCKISPRGSRRSKEKYAMRVHLLVLSGMLSVSLLSGTFAIAQQSSSPDDQKAQEKQAEQQAKQREKQAKAQEKLAKAQANAAKAQQKLIEAQQKAAAQAIQSGQKTGDQPKP
jgi:hypothetical protein